LLSIIFEYIGQFDHDHTIAKKVSSTSTISGEALHTFICAK